jgi:DNA-directed RNA polymerase specialized sigma24 family protein
MTRWSGLPRSGGRRDGSRRRVLCVRRRPTAGAPAHAYLLTGDRHAAEDLLQTALTRTYLHWRRIRDGNAIDAYVRKVMVNEQTSWWRRRLHHESATDTVPERAAPQSSSPFDERDAMWMLVRGLPPRQRAAVVLRYYETCPRPMSPASSAAPSAP